MYLGDVENYVSVLVGLIGVDALPVIPEEIPPG